MAERGVRWFVAAAAAAALIAYAVLYGRLAADPAPIRSDGYSYYVYLPATFIYHDPSLEALSREWYGGNFPDYTGIRRWPTTGRWLNLHPIGTAVLEAPFFIAADLLTRWSNLPRDGFSVYYQHAAAVAGLTYFLAGLAILRRLLAQHFTPAIVLATLVCITWGTNLFHYGVYDGSFSHAFAFFLTCAWIAVVDAWWRDATLRLSAAVGVVAALIVLTRHTNAIFLAVLPLFGVERWRDVAPRMRSLVERRRALAVAALVGGACVLPQAALYKFATGAFIVNAYETHDMGFSFASPHLAAVLFSTQKGLFFWSPILLLSVAGAALSSGWARRLTVPAAIVFALQTYLVASWAQWQYGASFGHRAFTDALGLAAPFLAVCFERAALRRPARYAIAIVAAAAVLLSVAQMTQYWIGVLPMADTTWAQYRALFLRFR